MGEALIIWYLPEHITHLYYSPVYATLSPGQKLAYNRLHACYHCEICAFLEGELPRYYLKAVAAPRIPERLRREAQALADSEKRHAAAFRALDTVKYTRLIFGGGGLAIGALLGFILRGLHR